jgi:phosphate starvation-inducible membrane PsiE
MLKAKSFSLHAKYLEFLLIFYAVLNVIYAIGIIVKRNLNIFSYSELGGKLKHRQITSIILLFLWLSFLGLIVLNSLRK